MTTETKTQLKFKPNADAWFAFGSRLRYDFKQKKIVPTSHTNLDFKNTVHIWNKVNNKQKGLGFPWITMMPGFPDGSFGWASTEKYLSGSTEDPQLYIEYIGMGDSDKPKDYNYNVFERADMIEALWKHHDVKKTTLVTFDFSSLVALELMSRQIDKLQLGISLDTTITKVFLINGGLFADSHSHPVLTTPLLKTSFGRMGAKLAQHSKFAFNMMMKDLWSKDYGITKEELTEIHNAVGRHEGAVFMSDAAGFVDEHKRNAKRWDLKRVFEATYLNTEFMVAGSEQDQFEPKQVVRAKAELEHLGLKVKMFPGGHMTTSEYPDLISIAIQEFKSKL